MSSPMTPPPLPSDPPHAETVTVEADVERDNLDDRMTRDAAKAQAAADTILSGDDDEPPTIRPVHNLERAQESLQSGSILPPTEYPILRLANIRLVGSTAVRPSFLSRLCRPYVDPEASSSPIQRLLHTSAGRLDFPPPGSPTTLPGILQLTAKLADDLQRLDIYSGIDASLMPSLAPFSPGTAIEDVDVLLQLKESPRFFLKSSTDVGNGEGSVSLQGRIRNLFGGAEKLHGSYEMGTRTKVAMNVNFTTPILASPDHAFSLSTFLSERDKSFFASCNETLKGIKTSITANDTKSAAQNEFSWELVWRNLSPTGVSTSDSMRKSSGHHIKSSLSHVFLKDTRDDPIAATQGSLLKSVTELAPSLLGGDTNFVKWESEATASRRFNFDPNYSWSLGLRSGLIQSLTGQPEKFTVPFSDKFHLGGPTCIRMFRMNGMGPKDDKDSLGGEAFYSAGVSLFGPIPNRPSWPLRLHAFFNAGQLGDLSKRTLLQPSTSAGCGLLYTQGPLRLELNAGMPLTAKRTDSLSKGFQIGVGVSFLS